MRAINQVSVVGERNTRIRVTKLTLCDLRRGARLEECRGVHMAKRMEPRTRDLQRITQWPQSFVNNRVRRVWLALPVREQETFSPAANEVPQHLRKFLRNQNGVLALCGIRRLDLPVPRGFSNVENTAGKVHILNGKSKYLAGSEPGIGGDGEHDAPWITRQIENRFCLLWSEGSRLLSWFPYRKHKPTDAHTLTEIAPVLRRVQHRGKRTHDVEHGLARGLFGQIPHEHLLVFHTHIIKPQLP